MSAGVMVPRTPPASERQSSSSEDHQRSPSRIAAFGLLTRNQRPRSPNSRESLEFATLLIQTFGLQYREQIRQSLGGRLSRVFDDVHRSFYEIQQKVALGVNAYVKHQFPNTETIIGKYFFSSCSDAQAFAKLKRRSYETLPFLQKMFTYRVCERQYFDAIDAERRSAFNLMLDLLQVERVEEKKSAVRDEQGPSPLDPTDELAITSLYYNGGALIIDKRTIYFSDMIEMWASLSQDFQQRNDALLACMNVKKYLTGLRLSPRIAAFIKHSEVRSFREFLVISSVEAIQKNFGFEFPDILVSYLATLFHNEEIRLDLCYFSANPALLFLMDLRSLRRDSAPYLETIQLFYFLIQTQGVKPQYWGALFLMLFHRSEWQVGQTEGFQDHVWREVHAEENQEFSRVLLGLEALAQVMIRRKVDFSRPTEEDRELLTDSHLVDTLFFLWKHPRRVVFIDNLLVLARDPRFNLSFHILHEFCQTNRDCILPQLATLFVQKYQEVLQKFTDKGLAVTNAQDLFMAPSLGAEVSTEHALRFGHAPTQAAIFINEMERYQRPIDGDFLKMLREWILRPKPDLWKLLAHARAVGVQELNRGFFSSVMKQEHPPLGGVLSDEANAQAVKVTQRIQASYQFSDVEIFYLYMEVVRLVLKDQVAVVGRIAQLIDEMTCFCPYFHRQDVYFLFQYHPKVAPEEIEEWVKLRIDWAKSDVMVQRFVIPQPQIEAVLERARTFSASLTATCPREDFRATFEARVTQSLACAFYPPVQPLTDALRIKALSPGGEVAWENAVIKTHEGQMKLISSNAHVGIYFNWEIHQGKPVFFLSFFDMSEKRAYSAFLPLEVPLNALTSEKIETFFSLLRRLGCQLLREDPDENLPVDSEESLETCASCYREAAPILQEAEVTVKEGTITEEQISSIWGFFQKLKVMYRSLYLSCVAERAMPPFPSYDPNQIAGLGHIFPSHARGALLPKAIFQLQTHPEFFIPDLAVGAVEQCREKFKVPTQEFQPLEFSLNIPGRALPVTYHVESVAHRQGIDEHQLKEIMEEHEIRGVKSTYVTLCQPDQNFKIMLRYPFDVLEDGEGFQTYFDYHNLLLKSHIFRIAS